jgi:hypothetical protein
MSYYYKYIKYKNKYLVLKNYDMIGGILPYQKEYDKIITIYKNETDKKKFSENAEENIIKAKRKVIDYLSSIINQINIEKNKIRKALLKKDFLNLRILMDNKFMKDINCQYAYIATPKKYGCDLLELIYNILSCETAEEIKLRNAILTGIASCSLEKSSIPHIMTDIDDTIYPYPGTLGINLAGSDFSWKKKELYPGIKKFYEEFNNNIKNIYKDYDIIIYNTILSATPTALKSHKLEDNNLKEVLGANFSFLSGEDSKKKAISNISIKKEEGKRTIEPDAENVGNKKFEKFLKYKTLFPEYKLLFIGDNGQGDLIAGERMLITDEKCMVFIHNIINKDFNFKFDEKTINTYITKPINTCRLFFFKNYYELSQIFLSLSLLDKDSVDRIKDSVKSTLVKDEYDDNIVNKNYYCCEDDNCKLGCIKK